VAISFRCIVELFLVGLFNTVYRILTKHLSGVQNG
jgi:hypothetical protein